MFCLWINRVSKDLVVRVVLESNFWQLFYQDCYSTSYCIALPSDVVTVLDSIWEKRNIASYHEMYGSPCQFLLNDWVPLGTVNNPFKVDTYYIKYVSMNLPIREGKKVPYCRKKLNFLTRNKLGIFHCQYLICYTRPQSLLLKWWCIDSVLLYCCIADTIHNNIILRQTLSYILSPREILWFIVRAYVVRYNYVKCMSHCQKSNDFFLFPPLITTQSSYFRYLSA